MYGNEGKGVFIGKVHLPGYRPLVNKRSYPSVTYHARNMTYKGSNNSKLIDYFLIYWETIVEFSNDLFNRNTKLA
jgi:hypothetical protein